MAFSGQPVYSLGKSVARAEPSRICSLYNMSSTDSRIEDASGAPLCLEFDVNYTGGSSATSNLFLTISGVCKKVPNNQIRCGNLW